MKLNLLSFILVASVSWPALADIPGASGKLPRPSPKASTGPKVLQSEPAIEASQQNCLLDLMSPPGDNGTFSPDGKIFYLLATERAAPQTAGTAKRRYSFLRIDLERAAAVPSVALSQLAGAALVNYTHPIQGISAVVFRKGFAGCYSGEASLVSVSFKKKKDRAVRAAGRYTLVQGEAGLVLFDDKLRSLVEIDYVSFQQRVAHSVKDGERPLFFDAQANIVVVLEQAGRRLLAYKTSSEKPFYQYGLMPGEQLLQTYNAFAVVSREKSDRFTLKELGQSTGKESNNYVVKIPDGKKVEDLRLRFHPTTKLLILEGATPELREEWRRSYVINYATGKTVQTIQTPPGQLVQYSGMSRDGRRSVFEFVESASRELRGLSIVDHNTGERRDVKGL